MLERIDGGVLPGTQHVARPRPDLQRKSLHSGHNNDLGKKIGIFWVCCP